MSFTDFSGPLRTGTQRNGLNSQGRNTGLVVLGQSFDSGDMTGVVVSNVDTVAFTMPRGSQITAITFDQVVAAGTGTMTVSVGLTSGGAELAAATATTAGGRFTATTTAATQLAWQVSTVTDPTVYVRVAVGTGTLTAGRVIVNLHYIQRADNGAQNPNP